MHLTHGLDLIQKYLTVGKERKSFSIIKNTSTINSMNLVTQSTPWCPTSNLILPFFWHSIYWDHATQILKHRLSTSVNHNKAWNTKQVTA